MAVWKWAKGDPSTVSTRQREHTISTRTTTQPRSNDSGAEDRSGAALAAETPFGSDRPDPYAELDEHREDDDKTSAIPSWTLPQIATVLAGSGAAATSTLVGGHLGVAGTVVGAAVASIVANLALNLYDNTLKRVSYQTRTFVGRKLGRDDSSAPSPATSAEEPTGSSPAQPWRRRPVTRKVIRWTLVTALASTLLGLGLMVGIERSTATQITPGTSQLAGTAERSNTGSDVRDSGTTGSGTTGQSEVQTDTEVVAPSVAPTGEETIVPTEVPTPGASTDTSSDTTTSDGPTGADSGTSTDGTTSGDTSPSGGTTTDGTTTDGSTSSGSGTTSGGTGTGSSGTTDGGTSTTP